MQNTTAKRRPRGPISRTQNVFLGSWMPTTLVAKIDEIVNQEDSDRSKFIRAAVREKLSRQEAQ